MINDEASYIEENDTGLSLETTLNVMNFFMQRYRNDLESLIQYSSFSNKSVECSRFDNLLEVASEYAILVLTALTTKETLDLIENLNNINIAENKVTDLYSIPSPEGRVYPRWQTFNGILVPHILNVLEYLPNDVNPLLVNYFFTRSHLHDPGYHFWCSPRDWLIQGKSMSPVIQKMKTFFK